jgi:hypothetical protein
MSKIKYQKKIRNRLFLAAFIVASIPIRAFATEAWWEDCSGDQGWTQYCEALKRDGWPEPKEHKRMEYVTKTQSEEEVEKLAID